MKKTTRVKTKAKSIKKAKKEIKEVKPKKEKKPETGLILVHNPANINQEFFVSSEIADDQMIEQEILGQAMEHYVYSFDQEGKKVTGLSVAGVNEMTRQLTRKSNSGYKIRIVPDSLKIERDVVYDGIKGVEVRVVAENMVTGETGIGIKFESYKKKGKKGEYANTFAIEKAVSKAERNAKRKLIPEKAAVEMIKKFISENKYTQIQSQPARAISAPVAQKQTSVDYLGQLKTALFKAGAKTAQEAIDKFNDLTGEREKTIKVDQGKAKEMLWKLLSSPMGSNLK
jgi:hypothetical protein